MTPAIQIQQVHKRFGAVQALCGIDLEVAPGEFFGLLGPHQKGRLEAANIGSGRAWIATNGVIVKGTWRKASATAPTRFYDAKGRPATLTVGQTFVQVIPPGTSLRIANGKRVFDAATAAGRGVR